MPILAGQKFEANGWNIQCMNSTGNYTLLARVSSAKHRNSFQGWNGWNHHSHYWCSNTGGFQSWQSVIIPNIPLTVSDKVMRVYYITGGYNLNYISFSLTVNQLPSANAGTDQNITLPTNSVSLNGSGTDPDGTITTYLWRKLLGQQVETLQTQTLQQQL